MADQQLRNGRVVVQNIVLGGARRGVQDLVQVANSDVVPIHREVLVTGCHVQALSSDGVSGANSGEDAADIRDRELILVAQVRVRHRQLADVGLDLLYLRVESDVGERPD